MLGVEPDAPADVLASAYHRLARHWHPDLHMQASEDDRARAAERMRRLNEAWEVLADPVSRAAYDHRLQRADRHDGGPEAQIQLEYFWRLGFARGGGIHAVMWRPGEPLFLRVADATDLRPLQRLAPDDLWGLSAYGRPVGDADLADLAPLTGLRLLDLGATGVTDAGLVHLADMHRLDDLSVAGTAVTDRGIGSITHLAELSHLNLADTAVTDAVIDAVRSFRDLTLLNLRGTRITADGVERLAAAFPDLHLMALPDLGWRESLRLRRLHPHLVE